MAIDPKVKENWEKLQTQHDYPVDALGRPIDTNDAETLKIWQEEGIDHFMAR